MQVAAAAVVAIAAATAPAVLPAHVPNRGLPIVNQFLEYGVTGRSLQSLLQPGRGGLLSRISDHNSFGIEPRFKLLSTDLGAIGAPWHEISCRGIGSIRGNGVGLTTEKASIPVIAESLERYCCSLFYKEQFITATNNDLGSDALDLDSVPRCSVRELKNQRCAIQLPDKRQPIRWVQALSLSSNTLVHVPVVMAYAHAGTISEAERFWNPISTGCAAHVSYELALFAAICEVVERDAVALTWLQQLELPEIVVDMPTPHLEPYWNAYRQSAHGITFKFYDATTELGIPTVYALRLAPHSELVRTLAACATGSTIDEAIAKTICDLVMIRPAFPRTEPLPECVDDFKDTFHGAAYMARAEHRQAFDFLLRTRSRRRLSEYARHPSVSSLCDVLASLKNHGMEVYAVDLSSDEAIRHDMRVVRVIIPSLMPISFSHAARFLGTPRLYSAPSRLGYVSRDEERVNHWPLPFA